MPDKQLKRRLSFIDNLDENTREKIHPYRITGLSEALTPIITKTGLDEKDARKAIELALEEVFSHH